MNAKDATNEIHVEIIAEELQRLLQTY